MNSGHNDHLLTAHRYISNEMSDAEIVDFEILLESDIEVQAALADAVMIQSAFEDRGVEWSTAAPSSSDQMTPAWFGTQSFRKTHRRLFGTVSPAIAVCFVISLIAGFSSPRMVVLRPDDERGADEKSSPTVVPYERETVLVWAELANVASETAASETGLTTDHRDDEPMGTSHSSSAENSLEVPDWLLAVVSAQEFESTEPSGPLPTTHPLENDEETL